MIRPSRLTLVFVLLASIGLAAQTPTSPTPLDRAKQLQLEVGQLVDALTPAPASHVIAVPADGKLQAAIDAAQPGDTIALTPGATYTGAVILKNKDGSAPITITTGGVDLPPGRMTPAVAAALQIARILSGTTVSAFTTEAASHNYRLVGLEVSTGAGLYPVGLVRIGAGDATQSTLDSVPAHFVVDRCYIHGDPDAGAKRGIDANGADVVMTRNYIADIKGFQQDTQAIGGTNGPGPITIVDNYLEASGENVMFGGGDPFIPNLIPSGITISGNTLSKPLAWRTQKWQIKNLFELKNAQAVHVFYNVFENVWVQAQTGFAVLVTVRNQSGTCPWCTVRDVEFDHNVVRHASQGVQILALDDQKNNAGVVPISVRAQNLAFHDNLFYDIDRTIWGGDSSARDILISSGPIGVSFTHDTWAGNVGGFLSMAVGRTPTMAAGLAITCNLAASGTYGIKADALGSGAASWTGTTDAASKFVDNALQPPPAKITFPPGNRVAAYTLDAGFLATPPYLCSDGLPAGVDTAALVAAIPGLDLAK